MSLQSRLSTNDKGDNEIIPGAVHKSLGIYLTAKKTPKNPARRPSMKAVRPVILSNGVPSLQMRSVVSHSTSGIEKEAKKERTEEGK